MIFDLSSDYVPNLSVGSIVDAKRNQGLCR
jgi:hypothetical protein